MAISELAKQYHEKMFPDGTSEFSETDPESEEPERPAVRQ